MHNKNTYINITTHSINILESFEFVAEPHFGANASFIGTIRDNNKGRQVLQVSYDIHHTLTMQTINNICKKNLDIYGTNNIKQYIALSTGTLAVGQISIVINVATPHRKEAFAACRFILEEIKHKAPIWKQEHYHNGTSNWVQGHALCQEN